MPHFALAETTAERDQRMKWWREARFGMFIHWGLYAVPAGEYNGQRSTRIGEWIMEWANIPRAEYEKFAPKFNPVKFNAREWVQHREKCRHEVHRHHLEASRRICTLQQQGQQLRHHRLHSLQKRSDQGAGRRSQDVRVWSFVSTTQLSTGITRRSTSTRLARIRRPATGPRRCDPAARKSM